jgi:subtilisin-like proprotein convertase family protein
MLDFLPQLRRAALLSLTIGLPLATQAQSARPAPATPWADDAAARLTATGSEYASWLHNYRPVTLDLASLRPVLAAAPMEGSAAAARGTAASVLALPLPDGTTGRFRLVEAPVMAPSLAAQYPQIKTYAGVGLDDPTASIRCDLTPLGFHAQILSERMGTIYIDPVSINDHLHYLSFFRRDMNRAARGGHETCGFVPPVNDPALQARQATIEADANLPTAQRSVQAVGTTLRTYRLALAANREYVMARGGTTTSALASMNTSVNRVVGVYEKELAVRLVLVPNTNLLITTTANAYTNNNGGTMLGQNQTRVDQIIGSANYDIGHVFSTGGGGIAGLGVVCQNGQKARGVTGSPSPTGDAFDIDYVAHEMGHQFGGNHPFNAETGACGGGNRNPLTSWEPGSGSTIMAYAGICGNADNVQNNSDAYFHTGNFQEIQAEINTTSCFVTAATGNTAPTVTGPVSGRTIPKGTPFRLTAVGQDADGDALTYNWEEMDRGGNTGTSVLTATNQRANQTDPLFRSFTATSSPTRYFPQLAKIIANATPVKGEAYPQVARQLKFRCTVRDQHASAALGFIVGGVDYTPTISLTVASTAGPFVVQAPDGPGGPQWYVGSPATVTWAVANTNMAPVSCSNVDLLLSRDNGLTYTDTLAANVPNSGAATFTVPSSILPTTQARVMVHARDNYFFDISNASFSILAPLTPDYALNVAPATRTACPGVDAVYTVDVASLAGFVDPVALTVSGAPAGVTATFAQTTVTPGTAAVALTVTATTAVTPGSYPLTVTATTGANVKTQNITLVVSPQVTAASTLVGPADAATAQPLAPTFTWTAVQDATTYTFELSNNAQFTGTLLASVPGLTTTTYALTGVTLAANTPYYWRVRAENGCGAGPNSTAFSFTTIGVACSLSPAANLPVAVTSASVVNAVVNVGACDLVQDVNVKNLRITYPNSGDLDIFLVSPSGRATLLASGLCANGANLNLNFDDQAAVAYSAIPCPASTGGTYQSLGGMSRFVGEAAGGNWTLRVIDNTAPRNGLLTSWTLELCTSAVVPALPTNVVSPTYNDHMVQVTWTDNACNETQQVIERSVGGTANFQPLTTVAANIATYTDLTVAPATQYCYRVRAESATLQSANSTEVCVTTSALGVSADALSGQLTVAPNPSAGEFTVRLTDAPAGVVRLSVVDALGRVVEQSSLTAASTSALTHTVDLRAKAEGVYTLRLTLADGRTAIRRLVKM